MEPKWVGEEEVLLIHRNQIAAHGGVDGLRDANMLESALVRAQQQYHYADPPPSLTELAAAYAYGIVKNHAFVDGNKRTALTVCGVFLLNNGMRLDCTDHDRFMAINSLAASEMSEREFAEWLEAHTVT